MCGLVGVAGYISKKEEQMFRTMLILDTIRGDHSTGIAMIDSNDNTRNDVVKVVGPPSSLFRDENFIAKDRLGFRRVLLGHNRFATRGKVNIENAHPFKAGHIIGAHNGTLENKWDFPNQGKFETDSEAFYNMLSEEGVEKAVGNCRGAWAFTFWDEKENTMNLIRNKERTLFFTTSKDNKTFMWASEDWMLKVAAARAGVNIGEVYLEKEDTLLSIPIHSYGLGKEVVKSGIKGKPRDKNWTWSKGGSTSSAHRLDKAVQLEVIGFKKYSTTEYYELARLDGKYPDFEILMYKSGNIPMNFKVGDIIETDVNVYEKSSYALPGLAKFIGRVGEKAAKKKSAKYLTHKGKEVTKKVWEQMYQYCAWCSSDLDADNDKNLMLSSGDVLCEHCQKDKEILPFLQGN